MQYIENEERTMNDNIRMAKEMLAVARVLVAGNDDSKKIDEVKAMISKVKQKLGKKLGQFAKALPSLPPKMRQLTVGYILVSLHSIANKEIESEENAKDYLNDMPKSIAKLKQKSDKSLMLFSDILKDMPQDMKKMTVGDLFSILHAVEKNEPEEEKKRVSSARTAGEVASKDGKYGKKDDGWNGTIDYNGTRGVVSNAVFELKNGRIVWTDGTWHSGIWAYGLWKDGLWQSGTWQMGEWENGIWMSGTWMYGTWYYGIWKQAEDTKSVWMNGTWKNGIWEDGTHVAGWWEKGIWQKGTWEAGTFWTGTWNGGTWNGGLNWYGEWHGGTWNKGQWNEGTWLGGTWNGGFDKKKNWHPANATPNRWKTEK